MPASPTPAPMKTYAAAICQYGDALVPDEEHPEERGEQEHVAAEQREAGAAGLDELRRTRSDDDHDERRRDDRGARLRVEYPMTFCRYCWLTNMAAISEPKTMMPAHAATQKTRRRRDVQVVQRVRQRGAGG